MNPRLRMLLRWLPAVAWMVLIFCMSHQPGGGSGALSRLIMSYLAQVGIDFQAWFGENAVWVLRKCAHFTEYMLLFFLLLLGLRTHLPARRARWWALAGVLAYACTDEFHQLFIPGRVGDPFDVAVDTSGGLLGFLLFSLIFAIQQRRALRQPIVSRTNQAR